MDIDKRLADLRAKLKARKRGGIAYAENCVAIEREIIRLENLKSTTIGEVSAVAGTSKDEQDDTPVAS